MGLMRREAPCPECEREAEFRLCPHLSSHPRDPMAVDRYQCQSCEAVLPAHTVFDDVNPPALP